MYDIIFYINIYICMQFKKWLEQDSTKDQFQTLSFHRSLNTTNPAGSPDLSSLPIVYRHL